MNNRLIIFLFCIMGLCGIINAQIREIKGQVLDNGKYSANYRY